MAQVIPAAALAEQLALVTNINALVAEEIVRNWQLLSPESRLSTRLIPDLLDIVTEIATAYGEISGITAADFYDYLGELAGAHLPAAIPVDPTPPAEQVEAMVRWATGPLRFAEPLPEVALKRITGATQRLTHQAGRMTTIEACRRDRVRYARVPQGKTCAWCTMLASRGAVYWSEATAGAPSLTKYHDHCDCATVAIHDDSDLPEINRQLHDEWNTATAGARNQRTAWRKYVRETYGVE